MDTEATKSNPTNEKPKIKTKSISARAPTEWRPGGPDPLTRRGTCCCSAQLWKLKPRRARRRTLWLWDRADPLHGRQSSGLFQQRLVSSVGYSRVRNQQHGKRVSFSVHSKCKDHLSLRFQSQSAHTSTNL